VSAQSEHRPEGQAMPLLWRNIAALPFPKRLELHASFECRFIQRVPKAFYRFVGMTMGTTKRSNPM
jgi:hypothetical protein